MAATAPSGPLSVSPTVTESGFFCGPARRSTGIPGWATSPQHPERGFRPWRSRVVNTNAGGTDDFCIGNGPARKFQPEPGFRGCRLPVQRPIDFKRPRQPPGPAHLPRPTEQDCSRILGPAGDHVQQPVYAIAKIYVPETRRAEHHRVAGGRPTMGVRGAILKAVVRLHLCQAPSHYPIAYPAT